MKKIGILTTVGLLSCALSFSQDYKLVWQDNFDGTSLNSNVWSVESNIGVWNTGANKELQHYKHENIEVGDDGNGNNCLIITAKKEQHNNYEFTSGKIESKGKFTFKYGKLEARIKVPNLANGLWPAFWTIGNIDKGWPDCGEIDILEMGHAEGIAAGTQNKHFSGALHWEHANNYAGYGKATDNIVDLNNDFHLFTLVWSPTSIKMFLDNAATPYYEMTISGTDLEEFKDYTNFIILNLAVGGQFPGIYKSEAITAPIPAKMYVDYVKLYQIEGEGELNTATKVIGKFGTYTETASVYQKLDFNFDGEISASKLNRKNDEKPKEGINVLSFNTLSSETFNLSIGATHSLNMSNFTKGTISFFMKTNIQQPIKIGIADASGKSSFIELKEGISYNIERDNSWRKVTIPIIDFTETIDLTHIKKFLIIEGTSSNESILSVDNVIWNEVTLDGSYLGLYTENPTILNKIIPNDETVFLYIWENSLSVITNAKPYEGIDVLALKDNGIGWYGFGLFSSVGIDATEFKNGYLIFTLKTTSTSNFWIGVGGANDTEGKVLFNNGKDPYNFKRNGQYQTIVVPMSKLNESSVANKGKDLDLTACGNILMFGGDKNLSEISIDDVYLSISETPIENSLIAVLTKIQVTPATKTLVVGESVKLKAKGLDQFGGNMGIDVAWSVSDNGFITETGEFVAISAGTFTVTATAGGINGTATVVVQTASKTIDIQAKIIKMYPVPVGQTLVIETAEPIQSIRVLDITGKPIQTNSYSNATDQQKAQIDLGHITNGIYLVEVIFANEQRLVEKFVKK